MERRCDWGHYTPSKCKRRFVLLFCLFISVGSQIVAHTQMETGDGPNKPNTINL